MKSPVTTIILLLSVCVTGYLFGIKHKWRDDDTQQFVKGLKGAKQFLPAGSGVVVKCGIPDSVMHIYLTGFAIAPSIVKTYVMGHDTLLLLLPREGADSSTQQLLKNSKVIWQYQDERYSYKLAY